MFNQEQIKELLKNKNVDKCSSTSITYNKAFKIQSIRQYYDEGYAPVDIFRKAGFDLDIIGHNSPGNCLGRWRRIYNNKGEQELIKENRGSNGSKSGRPKTNYANDKEQILHLKTKIAYLEEENRLLKKRKKLEKP